MTAIDLKKWVFKMMEEMILYLKIGLKDQIILKMNKVIFLIQQDQLSILLNHKPKINNLYPQSDLLLLEMMKF